MNLSELKAGVLFAKRYRVEKVLGAGGMGLVFKANDEQLKIRVAVKVLLKAASNNDNELLMAARRLKDEARATAMLSIPYLVKVFDAGEEPGIGPYIVYEFLPGVSLEDRIGEGELGAAQAMKLVIRPLLLGLAALHEKGIIHRDVKPGNLFKGHDGTYLLGDLGLAYFADKEARTKTGAVVGTMHYVALERIANSVIVADSSDDCYAAAHTIIKTLTGKHLRNLLPHHYPLLGKKAKPLTADALATCGITIGMAQPLVKAVQWDRESRYKSAKKFLTDLEDGFRGRRMGPKSQALRQGKGPKKAAPLESTRVVKNESSNLLKRLFFVFFFVALLGLALVAIDKYSNKKAAVQPKGATQWARELSKIKKAMEAVIIEPSLDSPDSISALANEAQALFPKFAKSHIARRKLAQLLREFPKEHKNSTDVCAMVKLLWEAKHGSPRRAVNNFNEALGAWNERKRKGKWSPAYTLGGMSRLVTERLLLNDMEIKDLEELAINDHQYRFKSVFAHSQHSFYLGHRVIDDMLCSLAFVRGLAKDYESRQDVERAPYLESLKRTSEALIFALKSPEIPTSQRQCVHKVYACFTTVTKDVWPDFQWPAAPKALNEDAYEKLLHLEFKKAEQEWKDCWVPHIRAKYKDGMALIAREHIRLRVINPTVQLMRSGYLARAATLEHKLFFLVQVFNLFASNEVYLAKAKENRFYVAPVDLLRDQLLLNYYEALVALEKASLEKGRWSNSAEILSHYEQRYGNLAKSEKMNSFHRDFNRYIAERRPLMSACITFNEQLRERELALQAKTEFDDEKLHKDCEDLLNKCMQTIARKENIPHCYPTVAYALEKLRRFGHKKIQLLDKLLIARKSFPPWPSAEEEPLLLRACADMVISTADLANELKRKDILAKLKPDLLYLRNFSREIDLKPKFFNRFILLAEESEK